MSQSAKVTQLKPAAFLIETGIPLPPRRAGGPPTSPTIMALKALHASPAGSSVFVPLPSPTSHANTIHTYAKKVGAKGWCTSRRIDGGWRVWRLG